MPRGPEALSKTVRVASAASLAGLLPHYLLFYVAGTPLWTDTIAEWIMAHTPSRYAVPILDSLGSWAKPWAETGGLAALGFVVFVARLAGNMSPSRWRSMVTVGAGFLFAVGLAWSCGYTSILGSLAFWGSALAVAAFTPRSGEKKVPVDAGRRQWLVSATRVGLPLVMSSGVVAVAAESFFRDEALARKAAVPADLFPFLPPLDRQGFGAGLVRSAVTPVPQFYGMSKNTVDPVLDVRTWRLTLKVNGRAIREYTYGDLLALQRQRRYVTLRCISNTLQSDLMGTAEWAGVALSQLIDHRVLPPEIIEAAFIGVEGHGDSVKLDYVFSDECLLALGMNGKTLSRTHGFPLRLLAPRYYGCRNVKWIDTIDFVSKPYYGTWQRLGYTREPVIHTASHIDRMRRKGELVEIGGVSFAGSRGIAAVRLRVRGGMWQPAALESPLSIYTWTRWTAQVRAAEGWTIEANAQDGSGSWQELAEGNPFPNGLAGPTIVTARV